MVAISKAKGADLDAILRWLKQEHDASSEGFYCNEEVIRSSFSAEEMFCLFRAGQAVGFGICSVKSTAAASIDILEIHPQHRGNGYGKALAKHLINYLFRSGAAHVSVKCAPGASEGFWRKLGFVEKGPDLEQRLPKQLWLLKGAP